MLPITPASPIPVTEECSSGYAQYWPEKTTSRVCQGVPELCQLTEDGEQGGLWFGIVKHRIGIRLTAPYSPEREETRKAKKLLPQSNNFSCTSA